MTQYTKPTVLPAWGESAGGADVLQPSNAEIQAGWPLTSVPPSRKRFNWILKYLAQGVRYMMQIGIPVWDATEDYPVGARVLASDGKTYKCIQTGINKDPTTQTAYWTRWGFTLAELNAEATTPAQFDNSTSLATTAFVKRSGLLFNSWTTYSATGNILLADAGKPIQLSPTTPITLTLPAANAAPSGVAIFLRNTGSSTATIQRFGSDTLVVGIDGARTSIVVQPGDDLMLITNSVNNWFCVSGSAQLSGSGQFSASVSGNGYKKGPAGEIDQWVYATTGTTNAGSMMVTLPVAFSSGFLSAIACSANYSNPATAVGIGGGSTLTQIQVYFAANTSGVFVRVLGK
jgi:hypothetical protein